MNVSTPQSVRGSSLVLATACILFVNPARAAEGDALFCIGRPDASPGEFGLVAEGYKAYPRLFPDPVTFTVGESGSRDWPFVHPAQNDSWAGGTAHDLTIRFHADHARDEALHLVIGASGGHSSERSTVSVRLNDWEAAPQQAPGGADDLVFQPAGDGLFMPMVFPVPGGVVREGDNALTIRLDGGSWILYDYVTLGPSPNPPARLEPAFKADMLANELAGVEDIIFAVRKSVADGHWYANIGYYSVDRLERTDSEPTYHGDRRVAYKPGGRLMKLDVRTGEAAALVDDPLGGVRDPAVHYDGRTIVFSYREGDGENYHLFRINADGSGLERLTEGEYDDIEPCWLPDGGIVFVSTRCKRWVNCWVTQVAVLHRMDPDGVIRPISANIEHDNTPWVLPDGRILYQRWEYVDRSQVDYHHLWTSNPDGTGQMVYYGNQRPATVMIDAKPIPGTEKVISVFSPGHGKRDHDGSLVVVDPRRGPDDGDGARTINGAARFRDPWAFSEDAFLAASGPEVVLLNGEGRVVTLHRLSKEDAQAGFGVHEPRPVIPRERERIIPPRTRLGEPNGRLVLANVYEGRNMEGVKPGEIAKLLVIESLPKPINYTGGMDPLTYGGSFTLERVLGTVPVEPDGSAYMELPALRSLFFVALDHDDLAVKRMQSFLTVQPGEVTSCVGCHEQRTQTIVPAFNLAATRRPPSPVEPIPDCPDVFDYPRDIQPILDRLCVDCHGYEGTERGGPYAGNVSLTGDRGPMFSHSYFTMTVRKLFSDGRNLARSNYAPRSLGSSASRILGMLDGSHYGAVATEREKKMLRLWIEVGAPYPGTYAALGSGSIGGYAENHQTHVDRAWPTTQAGAAVIDQRCASCHKGDDVLPRSMCDEREISFWRFDVNDPRMNLSRHIVFNLTRPERSLLVLAPLSKEAGGLGLCKGADSADPLFLDENDPDYKTLLAMVEAGRDHLAEIKRFDMPDFRPRAEYVREMQRYGVLPGDLSPDDPVDPYEADRAYWASLWYQPPH